MIHGRKKRAFVLRKNLSPDVLEEHSGKALERWNFLGDEWNSSREIFFLPRTTWNITFRRKLSQHLRKQVDRLRFFRGYQFHVIQILYRYGIQRYNSEILFSSNCILCLNFTSMADRLRQSFERKLWSKSCNYRFLSTLVIFLNDAYIFISQNISTFI